MKLIVTDNITQEDEQFIFKGLLEYNLSLIEDKNPRDLGIYLNDDNNKRIGGIIGDTHGNWLSVKYLWIDSAQRKSGLGSQLLEAAENEARNRGCKYVFLDTFSFQAPEFYKKHGYQVVFTLEEYPVTGKRYYFVKNL